MNATDTTRRKSSRARVVSAVAFAAMALPAAAQAVPVGLPNYRPGPTTSAARVVSEQQAAPASGFQWGDAGIGAGVAALLLASGATASGAMRRRAAHRTAIG